LEKRIDIFRGYLLGVPLLLFIVLSCARAPLKNIGEAMRPAPMPELVDDLPWNSLVDGLAADLELLKKTGSPTDTLQFGPQQCKRADYVRALGELLEAAKSDPSGQSLRKIINQKFDAYEVYGRDHWGEVLVTSYFEPVIDGSTKSTPKFSQPLFGRPTDMVEIDLASLAADQPALPKTLSHVLRGRLVTAPDKDHFDRVVAYPSRGEIDRGAVSGKAPILAFVDPIDAFILEIQGSGVVRLENGESLKLGFSTQNGHPYVPVAKFMFDVIPKEKMTLFAMENRLRTLPETESRKLMELNPSFVFFRILNSRGLTFFGSEVVDGRTVATDSGLFPKGTLAFLQFEKPDFKSATDVEPSQWKPSSRFVLDQDTGGAIRGPGHVDLFAGRGVAAKQLASVMKNNGHFYYFVPKVNP
jgi:membrane-bound lytic murein transglycosylase A